MALPFAAYGGLAVDVDDTLSDTLGYTISCIQKQFGNPENLSTEQIAKKYQYLSNVPYWRTPEIKNWLIEQSQSNEFQESMPVLKDADLKLRQIHKIVPIVLYITSRAHAVASGTTRWLRHHGFPEAKLMTGNNPPNGYLWKAEIIEKEFPRITGWIDDLPGMAEYLTPKYKGVLFLYNNQTAPRNDIKVIPCPTWDDVIANLPELNSLN